MMGVLKNFLRVLQRSRWASILNIAGLSVAFAVFIAILIQVKYEYDYNASFKDADHIYRLELKRESSASYASGVPIPLFEIIKTEVPELSSACIIGKSFPDWFFTVTGENGEKVVFEEQRAYADTSVVNVFDLDIVSGDARQALTVNDNVMIPLSLAYKFFGTDDVIGKTFLAAGMFEKTIAAVYQDVPANSTFQNCLYSASFATGLSWEHWNYDTYYKIPEGVDPDALNAKLYSLDKLIVAKGHGDGFMKGQKIMFCPLKDLYFADVDHIREPSGNRTMTNVLLLVGILVLVVAFVNFINFSTALAPSRIKGLNTRKTFGATDAFLRGCVVSEAVLFSFFSFLLGILWCYGLSLSSLQGIVYTSLNPLLYPGILFLTVSVSLLFGVLAGCYPAFYMTSFQPALVLKGSQALSPRGVLLRNTLVVFQYTISIVLIICTLFIGKQLQMMKNQPWGIDRDYVLYIQGNRDLRLQKDAFINELKNNHVVTDVTFASDLLGDTGMQHWTFDAMVNGEEVTLESDICLIASNYLNFFGIKVKEGDNFITTQDSVLMVNEAFKRAYNFDPMGKEMIDSKIGRVLQDFNFFPLQREIRPLLMFVNEQMPYYYYIRINPAMRSDALKHIRKTIREFSPNYGYDVKFLDDRLNSLYQSEERLSKLISVFGLVTILISLMGVYGLVLFNAKFKAKEIGVRKVNGATNVQIVNLLNRSFIRLIVVSFFIACPLGWYIIAFWLNGFAYKTAMSLWVFGLAGLTVLVITFLTISWQSWKAATANPVEVLKSE